MPNEETRDVSLREMIDAMEKEPDDATFRWFQTTVFSDGKAQPGPTLRVTMGQARKEMSAHVDEDLMCCECDTPLDDHGACPNSKTWSR